MIRYAFTADQLVADIAADDVAKKRKVGWIAGARKATAALRQSPKSKIVSRWSEIKSVYTKRQFGKCAFCERLLGNHELSAVEFDVEHFRPKNAVKPWPSPEIMAELGLDPNFPRSTAKGPGYRYLAYHPLNYASSCKTCNSRLKGNFFPIAGKPSYQGTDPVALAKSERPYLVYPLGNFDEDPEELIAFEGYRATPAAPQKDKFRHARGQVLIAFFRLNEERDDLLLLRAKQLDNLYTKLELLQVTKGPKRKDILKDIKRLAALQNDHAGCVRHLLKRYGDPERPAPITRKLAIEDLKMAREYVRSKLPA